MKIEEALAGAFFVLYIVGWVAFGYTVYHFINKLW